MNREIKFRAFCPEGKTMYKVTYINFLSKEVNIENETYDLWVDFDDVKLMQFTGLYDKHKRLVRSLGLSY